MARHAARIGRLVALIALMVGGVAAAVLAVPLATYHEPSTGVSSGSAATVTVVSRSSDLASPGSLRMTWTTEQRVTSQLGDGLITDVPVEPGSSLGCGAAAIELDGRVRLVLCGDRPLWRPVDAATRGPDADQVLAMVLGGDPSQHSQRTTTERRAAIRGLQAIAGWKVTGVLDPVDFVWIGEPRSVTAVNVTVGQRVTNGTTLFTTAPTVTSATVTAPGGLPMIGSLTMRVPAASAHEPIALTADGTIADVIALTAIMSSVPAASGTTGSPVTQDVFVQLADPVDLAVVPATAIISGATGECVRTTSGPVAVTPAYQAVGDVYVTGSLSTGTEILATPDKALGCS